ncbi:NAD(P)H-binding protein [Roseicella aquatilis]|uniref:NADH-ubiquinone oxidoreductase n=1 Tax=Roseicella aquatilis TaxID=2527868 RepID=A0A4V6P650_9PROT|nr:NmrA family NAD(P)-binding protein [Roseicella aquatilis]TCZ66660.1 NADH-ubiquinone oxidoreductase [Roseicella aquatilis]
MIAVIGASGRAGAALCRALAEAGRPFRPVVRDAGRWAATGLPQAPVLAELGDAEGLAAALRGAGTVVSCAHARWAPAILAASDPGAKLVLLGSTRRFSAFPDAHGNNVRAGEAAFLASGRPGVMLHPTMVYGAPTESNVRRLAALLRRLPVAPLPGGGGALVQPIHISDLVRCLLAAIDRRWDGPGTLVVAGPEAVPYRDFLAEVARAAGCRPPPVLPVPAGLLRALAPLTRWLPLLPEVTAAEIRRLTEDRAFDIGPMRRLLGVDPMPLRQGLRLTFGESG